MEQYAVCSTLFVRGPLILISFTLSLISLCCLPYCFCCCRLQWASSSSVESTSSPVHSWFLSELIAYLLSKDVILEQISCMSNSFMLATNQSQCGASHFVIIRVNERWCDVSVFQLSSVHSFPVLRRAQVLQFFISSVFDSS